ncbi:MAG: N-6 DNA methylase [Candidatus Parvarchaeum sp.]
MDIKESYIESEIYRVFKNVINQNIQYGDIIFYDIKDRMPVGDGEADIVVFGRSLTSDIKLVIETKKRSQKYSSKIDPYSVSVIGQAMGYAGVLGSQFIATTNGDIFVIFDTYKKGSILQSQVGEAYKVEYTEDFASRVLSDLAKYLKGELKLLNLSQIFIDRLRYFHQLLTEPTYKALRDRIVKDPKFSESYTIWIQKQGFKNNEQTKRNIGEQEAYLLMNRVLFYKTLEAYYSSLELIPLKSLDQTGFEPSTLINRMQTCFSYIVKNVDYQAVFKFSEILDEIPISNEVAEHLNDFIKDIEQYNLSDFDRDVIGDVYQSLIPIDERRRLGQYYTPKEICDLIVKYSIREPQDKVLDPSCGSGGFLVSSYQRLFDLNTSERAKGNIHNKIISQIYGVDINQFATHLSVMNLTLRDLTQKTNKLNIFPVDFFKIPSHQAILTQELERESLQERGKEFVVLNSNFDVIVANPPYTRQDEIGNKEYVEKLRDIALTFYERKNNGKKLKTVKSKIKMSTESGIYAYFFTHSSHFLKEHGIMGYIVSNSWLDVKFGIDLQRFFLDNFKITAIIDFDKRVFKDAAVNTVIILLQKLTGRGHSEEREKNNVKFIRIKRPIETDEIIKLLTSECNDTENETFRSVCISQRILKNNHKWSQFLKAPPVYYKIINNKNMTTLGDIANITVGYVTLANDFFVIFKEQAEKYGIETEYLRPAITKARNLKYLDTRMEDADSYLLFVNKDKRDLKGTNVLKYIETAEQKNVEITRGSTKGQIVTGYQNKPALKSKGDNWYKLMDKGYSQIIIPKFVWDRWYASLNTDGVYINDTFYAVDPKDFSFKIPLFLILNSTLFEFLIELLGKTMLGEGVLEVRSHILNVMPILNLNKIPKSTLSQLEIIAKKIIKFSRENNEKEIKNQKLKIDELIFGFLKINKQDIKSIYETLELLRSSRKSKVNTEIMVK